MIDFLMHNIFGQQRTGKGEVEALINSDIVNLEMD